MLNSRLQDRGVRFITNLESVNQNKFAVLDGWLLEVLKFWIIPFVRTKGPVPEDQLAKFVDEALEEHCKGLTGA